jgi:serine-type D-Ala-D-Ala carboxypeptidase (penicillin-binding protein 5/6)
MKHEEGYLNSRFIVAAVFAAALFFFAIANLVLLPKETVLVGSNPDSEAVSKSLYYKTLIKEYDPEASWEPISTNATATQPEISGKAAVLVDINSGEVLFEKNSGEQRKIASLVKIMTAIVALENNRLVDEFKISPTASGIGENTMALDKGEIYTLEELLYGLILNSGNDAAYAIAENTAGDANMFVEWMNIKADILGLNDTYFADPSGLDENSYSTPKDLIKLSRYALKDPNFKKIAATEEIFISGETHKPIPLYNQTNLLTTYPGVAGIKTGYTHGAGLCLITYAKNEDIELVGVVLDSADRKGDMILMLDHGYSSKGINVEHNLL